MSVIYFPFKPNIRNKSTKNDVHVKPGTAVACRLSKFQVELADRKDQSIPEGWAVDERGMVNDIHCFSLKSGCLYISIK